jgi:hypothetical protein
MTIALLIILSIISLIAWIWLLVVAFKEHVMWGLGVFFLSPILAIVFAIMHWQEAKKPFLIYIITTVLVFGMYINLFSDAITQSVEIAQQQESGQISEEEAQRRMFEMFGMEVPPELQQQATEQQTTENEITKLTEQLEQGGGTEAPQEKQRVEVFNPIRLSQAKQYIGRTIQITTRSGVVKKGTLKTVHYDRITLERQLRGGDFAFDVRNSDIERLEVQDWEEY